MAEQEGCMIPRQSGWCPLRIPSNPRTATPMLLSIRLCSICQSISLTCSGVNWFSGIEVWRVCVNGAGVDDRAGGSDNPRDICVFVDRYGSATGAPPICPSEAFRNVNN
jgi:hypothetical protein